MFLSRIYPFSLLNIKFNCTLEVEHTVSVTINQSKTAHDELTDVLFAYSDSAGHDEDSQVEQPAFSFLNSSK